MSITGYEGNGRNRDGGKQASGCVAVQVHKSLESRIRNSGWCGLS